MLDQRDQGAAHERQLGWAREKMAEIFIESMKSPADVVHLIIAPTGVGKTTMFAPFSRQYNVAWAAPYHRLRLENDHLKLMNHVQGLDRLPCQHYLRARVLREKGLLSGIVHDSPCIYMAQFKPDASSFYVHQHLYSHWPWVHEVLVIDEAPMNTLLRTRKVDTKHYSDYTENSDEWFFLHSLNEVVRHYRNKLRELATEKGVEAARRYYYMMGQEVMYELDVEMGGKLEEVLMFLNVKHELNTLTPKPDEKLLDRETIDLQLTGDLIAIGSAMYEELPRYRKHRAYNSRIQLSRFGLSITQALPVPEQIPHTFVLSATADPKMLESIFRRKVIVHSLDVGPHPSTQYIALDTVNSPWTRSTFEYGTSGERIDRLARICRSGLNMVEEGSVGLITFQPIEEQLAAKLGLEYVPRGEEELDDDGEVVEKTGDTMHYGNVLGRNGLEDKDILIVAGRHRLPESEVMRRAHARHYHSKSPILCKGDKRYIAIAEHAEHEELTQCAGRLRAACYPGKVLITIGTGQPDFMPEPEIVVEEVPHLTKDGRIRREVNEEVASVALEEAWDMLAERGYNPPGITPLAREAHVSKSRATSYKNERLKNEDAA